MAEPQTTLIKEPPLLVLPSLAKAIGLEGAVIVQQLYWLLEFSRDAVEIEGRRWIRRTMPEWGEQFRWATVRTLERSFSELRQQGLVLASSEHNASPTDRTLWYSLDLDAVEQAISAFAEMHPDKMADSRDRQNGGMHSAKTRKSPSYKDSETPEDSEDQGDRAPARAEAPDPEGDAEEMKGAIRAACLFGATTPDMDRRIARAAHELLSAGRTTEHVRMAARTWAEERRPASQRLPAYLVEQACRERTYDEMEV